MKLKIVTGLLMMLLYSSCNPGKQSENEYAESEQVYKEAIKIHDEVMPRMGEIIQLQTSLKEVKKHLSDETLINEINLSLQELENAHSSMMSWMRNIKPVPKDPDQLSEAPNTPSPEEMLEIQKAALKNIKVVQKEINESIDKAGALLSEIETDL